MPRLRLENPRPCKIFCFALIHYALVTSMKTFLLVSSSVSSKQLLCFVHGQGQKANKNIQQRTLSSFITIPLYQLCCHLYVGFPLFFLTKNIRYLDARQLRQPRADEQHVLGFDSSIGLDLLVYTRSF